VPDTHVQQVRLWTDAVMRREPGQVETDEQGRQAIVEQMAFYAECVQQHRAQPRDDLFSLLIDADIERDDGETSKLTDIEIMGFASQLGGAGAETVTKLMASAVYLFAQHRDQWEQLLVDPGKIPAAIEELLRYDNPVQYDVRRSVNEVTLHGVTIPAHKPVFLMLASANRDTDAWSDADQFNIGRDLTESQSLGLGYGTHSCLGAALARMESAVALEKLPEFMPRYEVDVDGCRRVHMTNVIGWSRVPVRVLR
jgi:cytochrome P450